jgi:hypothetical protein
MMDIKRLIDEAGFDEYDHDTGTSGLCAMFALALYRVAIKDRPRLILLGSIRDGKPAMDRRGGIYWSHAAVEIAGRFYDIEGEQQREWMIGNYLWGLPRNATPALHELAPPEFISQIRGTPAAVDWPFYISCRDRLIKAAGTISQH